MSAKDELQRAKRAIEDAVSALRHAGCINDPVVQGQVQRALRDLDDAERYLRRGIDSIPR